MNLRYEGCGQQRRGKHQQSVVAKGEQFSQGTQRESVFCNSDKKGVEQCERLCQGHEGVSHWGQRPAGVGHT